MLPAILQVKEVEIGTIQVSIRDLIGLIGVQIAQNFILQGLVLFPLCISHFVQSILLVANNDVVCSWIVPLKNAFHSIHIAGCSNLIIILIAYNDLRELERTCHNVRLNQVS